CSPSLTRRTIPSVPPQAIVTRWPDAAPNADANSWSGAFRALAARARTSPAEAGGCVVSTSAAASRPDRTVIRIGGLRRGAGSHDPAGDRVAGVGIAVGRGVAGSDERVDRGLVGGVERVLECAQ